MPARRKSSLKKSSRKTSSRRRSTPRVPSRSAKSSGRPLLLASGIIVIVVVALAAVLWLSLGNGSGGHRAATTTMLPTVSGTHQPASPGASYTVQGILTKLSSYTGPSQFTADYVGTVSSSAPGAPITFAGTLVAQYQRYGGSALFTTSERSNQSQGINFNSTSKYYYYSNGTSYYCSTNATSNYLCRSITAPFNISTFGFSPFLAALPGNVLQTPLIAINSSYNGLPCLALSAKVFNSTDDSGVFLNSTVQISACMQPAYKIPLELNISAVDTESGVYRNGTTQQAVPMQSMHVTVGMRMVNLTNSSSSLQVQNLPANAIIIG